MAVFFNIFLQKLFIVLHLFLGSSCYSFISVFRKLHLLDLWFHVLDGFFEGCDVFVHSHCFLLELLYSALSCHKSRLQNTFFVLKNHDSLGIFLLLNRQFKVLVLYRQVHQRRLMILDIKFVIFLTNMRNSDLKFTHLFLFCFYNIF